MNGWNAVVEEQPMRFGLNIAMAYRHESGYSYVQIGETEYVDAEAGSGLPSDAWLNIPRDAAVALMLALQKALAPDSRSVDREVLERCDEALAVERARVDKILDRDPKVIITDGTGGQV